MNRILVFAFHIVLHCKVDCVVLVTSRVPQYRSCPFYGIFYTNNMNDISAPTLLIKYRHIPKWHYNTCWRWKNLWPLSNTRVPEVTNRLSASTKNPSKSCASLQLPLNNQVFRLALNQIS